MALVLAENTDICQFRLTMFSRFFHFSCFIGQDFLQVWLKLFYQEIVERKGLTSM